MNIKPEIDKLVDQINFEAKSRAFRAANELRNSALTVLRGQRSGRVYKRPFSRSKYTASAPGEPPAVRSGDLRRSWRQRTASESTGKSLTVKPAITTDVKYAPWLDEGTDKMEPRPFEDPIIEDAKPKIKAIYSEPYLNK
ncbi:MAG TPA: hypothetical protein DEP23_06010 [Ruminococcaceae bacterium]|nr:hypothetical protein [Oscillospiraceae bacterium]